MDRRNETLELFRAYTVEELHSAEQSPVASGMVGYGRGENSSSYTIG